MPGYEEQKSEEAMSDIFREDKLTMNESVIEAKETEASHLVKLVAKVYWVDIIGFQIREHYNLDRANGIITVATRKGEVDDYARRKPCRRGELQP